MTRPGWCASLEAIARFERMLASEGALILKFMLVLSDKEQKRRLKAIAKGRGAGRHVLEEWSSFRRGSPRKARERNRPWSRRSSRRRTSRMHPGSCWRATIPDYRDLELRAARSSSSLRSRLDAPPSRCHAPAAAIIPNLDHRNRARRARHGPDARRVPTTRPSRGRAGPPRGADRRKGFGRRAVVAVFEGNDAAGKGGSIRRVTAALDPRRYRVYPVAAPTEEERAQPYLWRFWRHVPPQGPGRDLRPLLVRPGAGRAGRGVRELRRSGCGPTARSTSSRRSWPSRDHRRQVLARDRQGRAAPALQGARADEFKRFKITPEDWRNREKWDDYTTAVGRHGRPHQHRARAVDAGRGARTSAGRGSRC